jgi:bacillithiol biosynthesis deacetylase BshB1
MKGDVKIHLLAFGAHPDDVELSAGGTMAVHMDMGLKTGIIDLTQGELGTRGTPEIRKAEATEAAKILGLTLRENLGFRDGFMSVDEAHLLPIIQKIRQFRPDMVLANAIEDRHPDHGIGAQLVSRAAFLAGLSKIKTSLNGQNQEAWRPKLLLHYIQFQMLQPNVLVDVSNGMDRKIKAIQAYASQFYQPDSTEPITPIATKEFMESLHGRAADLGKTMGVPYAEGFTSAKPLGVTSLCDLR